MSAVTKTQDNKLIVGKYYSELDGLRAIAVILVVMVHSSIIGTFKAGEPEGFFLSYYYEFTRVGWCGVDLFFVLSGFLITGILMDTAHKKNCFKYFYIRRTVRIFPLYYMTLFLCFIFLSFSYETYAFGTRYFMYFLYLQNWFGVLPYGHIPYFDHFWSLAVEEQFYLVWPALFLFALKRSWVVPLCICLVVFSILLRAYLVLDGHPEIAYTITLTRMDSLVLGALLAYYLRQKPHAFSYNKVFVYFILVSSFFIGVVAFINGSLYGIQNNVIIYGLIWFSLLFTGIVGWTVTADPKSIFMRFLRLKFLTDIGRVSYGVYVFHGIIMTAIHPLAFFDDKSYLFVHIFFFTVCGGASYLLALVSFKYYEKPMLKLKDIYANYDKDEDISDVIQPNNKKSS